MNKPARVVLGHALWKSLADKADEKTTYKLCDGVAAVALTVKHFGVSA